jgi:multidrug efflux system membrane fusion protein
LRRVTIASYGADTVVLTAGLKAGERVVAKGVQAVSAGEKITPVAPIGSAS